METLVLVKPGVDKAKTLVVKAKAKTSVADKISAADKAKTLVNPPHNTHLSMYIKINSVFHHQQILNCQPSQ